MINPCQPSGRALAQAFALSLLFTTALLAAESRVPWTGSRITGTPDLPRPFVTERFLTRLTFNEALELATVPGTDRLLVVERRGKIGSFPLGIALHADRGEDA